MATDDSAEFVAQLTAHRKILFKVARLYCANDADREELTQDIVVQLWRSFARFDGRSAFATWMYRIALNVAISRVRQERRRPSHTVPLDDAVLETTRVAQQEEEDGDFADVAALLGRLDALDRALVMLHLEGHDHEAIATILGISVSNVGTKLHRLKQRLRQALAVNA